MKTKSRYTILFLTGILGLLLYSCIKFDSNSPVKTAILKGEGLWVGVAIADITPEEYEGIILEGYEPRSCNGVHDQLSARCITIVENENVIVMVSLDLIGLLKIHNDELIRKIKRKTGLDEDHIFIHCIHSHSGPAMLDIGNDSRKYRNTVNDLVVDAIVEAFENTQKVTVKVQRGISQAPVINRRHPKEEVLPKFTVLGFYDETKTLIASILNYSCHPVVLGWYNKEITADYVYFLRLKVEDTLGGMALFFNGSYGDINPESINDKWPYDRKSGTFAMAEDLGNAIADELIDAIVFSEKTDLCIKVKTEKCKLEKGKITQKTTHVSILDLGSLQIAMVPGEPLSGFGKKIESILPGPYTMLFGTVNDYQSYIVDEEEWGNCAAKISKEGCFEESISFDPAIANILEQGFQNLVDEMFSN